MSKGEPIGLINRRLVLAGGLATGVLPVMARAQSDFPARPLTIMAADPGGGADQLARLMRLVLTQDGISPRPVDVINRAGASGAIGLAELVSRHHGDPYRIMACGGGVVATTLAQNSPFRVSDAKPLVRLTADPMVIAVPPNSPFRNIQDFIANLKANHATVNWAGGSAGGVDHIMVASVLEACGLPLKDMPYIAYRGNGPASAAVLGGHVGAGVSGYGEWRNHAEGGRMRILATASEQRVVPQIPTLREVGLDVVLTNWRGVLAPPGLAASPLAWWVSAMERLHDSHLWQDFLKKTGALDGYLAGHEFSAMIDRDEARYSELLKRMGVGANSTAIAPHVFPAMIGVAGAVAIGATVVEHVRSGGASAAPAGGEDEDEGGGPLPEWRRLFAGAACLLAYIIALPWVGFAIATPAMVLGVCAIMGSKKRIRDGLVGLALTLSIWLLFSQFLHVELP